MAADTDAGSAADSVRIDAGVVVGVEARMTHTACDTEEAEVGAEHDERDAPIGAEAPSSDEGAGVVADELDDALVEERDVEEAEEVGRTCDVEPEGEADSRGQQVVAVEGRWSQSGDDHMSWTEPRGPAQDRSPTPQNSEVGSVRDQLRHHRPSHVLDHVHAPSLLHAQVACGCCCSGVWW